MNFRLLKSKSKRKNSTSVTLPILSSIKTDKPHDFELDEVQNKVNSNETTFYLLTKHVSIGLDADVDDLQLTMNKIRPEEKLYRISICDLWFRLQAMDKMEPKVLVTFLRTSQLRRTEIHLPETNQDATELQLKYITNRCRSRLSQFYICKGSDDFDMSIGSYVGLLLFSYDNQSKFLLNGHHCQRGDIIIKQIKFFSSSNTVRRGIYDALFKWYFDHVIDNKFIGIGFLCSNNRWRFDLITRQRKEIFRYEYRLFDMFMLTHWLTKFAVPRNAQEMEVQGMNIILKQYEIIKRKLTIDENEQLVAAWTECIGGNDMDFKLAIQQFIQAMDDEIKVIQQGIGVEL